MTSAETLVYAAAAMVTIFAMGWIGAARPLQLANSPALRLALGDVLLGAALVSDVTHYELPSYYIALLLPNLLAVGGWIALRAGLQEFLKIPTNWWEYLLIIVLVCVADAYFASDSSFPFGIPTVLSVALAWVAARLCREAFRPLRNEFSLNATLAILAPFALFGALLALRAAILASNPSQEGWYSSLAGADGHLALLWCAFASFITINMACLGLVIARLVGHIRELTLRDSLTGILNRRAVEMGLAVEYEKLRRHGQIFCIASIDLDRFDHVNDEFGHAAGDAALFHAVQIAKGELRNCDVIGRVGGEEFLVIFPMTRAHGGREAAERIRAALDQTPFAWDGRSVAVTASIGLAECFNPEEPAHSLLRRADDALYRAKNEGRNRVEVAPN